MKNWIASLLKKISLAFIVRPAKKEAGKRKSELKNTATGHDSAQRGKILLDEICELHAGFGYTVAQWLVDNNFTKITVVAAPGHDELTRAVLLPMKMNDDVFVKNYFTFHEPFELYYTFSLFFQREKFRRFDAGKICRGEAVFHVSPLPDARLKQAAKKAGATFFELANLVALAWRYMAAEEAISRLTASTPGLYAASLTLPLISQDTSAEAKRLLDRGINRPGTIQALREGSMSPERVAAYIAESGYSAVEWLEMMCYPNPTAYNDENGHRKFKDKVGKHVNIVNGHRLTTEQPAEYDNTIYLCGGCRWFGIGAADAETIASQLQKLLNEHSLHDKRYRVENYGHFLYGHYADFPRVICSITPRPGDIIFFHNFGGNFSRYPYLNLSTGTLPDGYGYFFWDSDHYTANLNRFVAQQLHAYMRDNIRDKPDPAAIPYTTQQIPLCGLQKQCRRDTALPSQYKDKLEAYKSGLRATRERTIGKIGSIVMNCNPFTLGHRYLIEHAASRVSHLFIFAVEEDKSFFPFRDRFELIKAGTADLENVTVLPSGQFIISSLTFSDYFQKSSIQDRAIDPSHDVELFAREIAPTLGVTVRFAGEEPLDAVTQQYNDAMRTILPRYGIDFEVIPRKEADGRVISASRVRALLERKDFDAIADLVPKSTLHYLMQRG